MATPVCVTLSYSCSAPSAGEVGLACVAFGFWYYAKSLLNFNAPPLSQVYERCWSARSCKEVSEELFQESAEYFEADKIPYALDAAVCGASSARTVAQSMGIHVHPSD